ncbi:asparagine synthase-related protein [Lederbergia sp. NSJ-179]|uniref:asparagine synthase-related protein n=1 Tax=Lederbergia sp. NSJ-179 TaxID=2931402 RepID=UPI001FCFB580|nr:asparagine synthase-related protein [Lederbergia sp. NSJ-179]MCJ7841918.1 asparagine synthase-related protein [Lederbergia sp. NSJ-179]
MKWFLGIIDLKEQSLNLDELHRYRSLETSCNASVEHDEIINNNSAFFISSVSDLYTNTRIIQVDNYYIVGDIRIDNRKDIINRYSIAEKYTECDEAIFLYLYKNLGESFIEQIIGEFSFVLWDQDNLELFCARDQLGTKTLFWLKENDVVYIASDLHVIGNKIDLSNLNNNYFNEYYVSDGCVDTTSTPYKNVFRLPSASWLMMNDKKVNVTNYWNIIENKKEIKYKKMEQYEEHFLEIMGEAVRSRMTSEDKNAVWMSGGLDSPTIFALAKQFESCEITPISSVYDEHRESDEREYIEPILQMYSTQGVFQNCDNEIFLRDFSDQSSWSFEPHVNSFTHAILDKMLWNTSHIVKAKNLFTGFGGDHVLDGTELVIADQLKRGKIINSVKNAYQYSYRTQESFLRVLWFFGIVPNLNRGYDQKQLLRPMRDNFNKDVRYARLFSQKEFIKQLSGITAHLYCDRIVARKYGIAVQTPFLDKRFIEFIYSTPGNIRWQGGIYKRILRQAMEGKLPEKVLWNLNKIGSISTIYKGLNENWPILYQVIEKCRIAEFGLITRSEWKNLMNNWKQGKLVRDDIYVLLSLEIWLYKLERLVS